MRGRNSIDGGLSGAGGAHGGGAVPLVPGLPNFIVVGLGDKAVTESKERVQDVVVVFS